MELSNPIVFQCRQCSAIVGDSFDLVAADSATSTVALASEGFDFTALTSLNVPPSSGAHNIEVQQTLSRSAEGVDAGCEFHALFCQSCNSEIGRQYVSTKGAIDHLRRHFTLHKASIRSYELGSGKEVEPNEEESLLSKTTAYVEQVEEKVGSLEGRVDESFSEIAKVRYGRGFPEDC